MKGIRNTLSFLFFFNFIVIQVFAAPSRHLCRPEQRDALINFKNEFKIDKPCDYQGFPKTESWTDNSDCCSWDGVTCDANFGYVIELNLNYSCLTGQLNSRSNIFRLQSLRLLDLSYNDFSGQISSSLANLFNLITLDLSQNYFNGQIPSSFGNLSKLTTLNLSQNDFNGQISSSLANLSNLTTLDLSRNNFSGQIPSSFGNLSKLTTLNLSQNDFNGQIPFALGKLSKLTTLYLSYNNFNGQIPSSLANFSHLKFLHLSKNSFTGTLPSSLFTIPSLRGFDISNNEIKGQVPGWLWSLLNLRFLDLSSNKFTGFEKPTNSRQASTQEPQMDSLDISNNEIKGQVPEWLWSLLNLSFLDLSSNKFTGFEKPTNSRRASTQEPQMMYLFGFNNNFTGKIPYFICGWPSLNALDLSNNKFSGSIPRCLGNLTLEVLNLKKNHLSGGLPENLSKSLVSLDIGHNQLVGKLPRSLVHISFLQVLNVESNKFSDTFPFWLRFLQELQVLVLRSNAFHGPIQKVGFSKLSIIDISGNHFNGTLPSDFFVNWTAMFSLGIAEGEYKGEYLGTNYLYSESMVLMNKGTEMKIERILRIFTAVDFSGNKFEGEIPSSIGLLKELHVLNLSNNAFGGHIPSTMANLIELESLDVSHNKLYGEIPQELGKLSFLSYMYFSHNQLVGPIPEGTQFQTQPCSSFEENLGLVGPTLDRACGVKHEKTSHQSEMREEGEEGEDEEEVISWIAVAFGDIYGISFGFIIGYILLSNESKLFIRTIGRNRR